MDARPPARRPDRDAGPSGAASPRLTAALPDGLFARSPVRGDFDAVLELLRARELADYGESLTVREDLAVAWGRPTFDLARDAIVVEEDGRLVAAGELFRGRAEGAVHPHARGRGIGAWLLDWLEATARAAGRATIRQTISDRAHAAAALLRTRGYEVARTSWILEIAFAERPAEPVPPAGIALRGFVPGDDDHAVYGLVEHAFSEWPDRTPNSFEDWQAHAAGRPGFDPSLVHVAVDGERIVGVSFGVDYPDEGGWVGQLAVAASHRRRGIARALLQRAFVTSWDRGERTVGLATDSRTGALTFYERVGMRVKATFPNYVRELSSVSSGSADRMPRTA